MNYYKYRWIIWLSIYILFNISFLSSYGQLTQEQRKAFTSADFIKIEISQEGDVKLDTNYFFQIAKVCINTAGLKITDGMPSDNAITLNIKSEIKLLKVTDISGIEYYEGARITGEMYFKNGQEGEFQKEFKNIHTLRKKGVWSGQQNVYINKSAIPYYRLFTGVGSYLDVFLKSMYEIYGEDFLIKCMLVDTMNHFSEGRIFSSNTLKYEFKKFAVTTFRETQDHAGSVPILINELYKFKDVKSSGLFYDERVYYYEVIHTLGEIGDTSAIEPLISLLEYSCENNLEKATLNIRTALINIGNPVINKLKQTLTTSSNNFKFEILVTLANLKDRTIIDQLLPYLNSTSYYEQNNVIEALGIFYLESDSPGLDLDIQTKIIKSLEQNLKDEDFPIVRETIHILEESGDKKSTEILLDFIENSGNIFLKRDAVKALYSIIKKSDIPGSDQNMHSRMVKIISESLTDQDISLTQNALYILKELKDYKAVEALIEFLGTLDKNQEPSYTIQGKLSTKDLKRYTVETLYTITGKNYGYNLAKWNKWWIRSNKE